MLRAPAMRTPLLGLLSVLPALGCGESGPALVLVAGALGGPGYADGTGTDARFRPQGVASDGAGNLYVADHDSLAIRKVVLATGEVTTLAGLPGVAGSEDGTGTEARFGGPRGVASDGAGNLFVTDTSYDPATPGGGTIRQVVIATGKVSTLAGSPGLAGSVDGIGADARFGDLQGVATDGAGNLFVADPDNGGIRKVAIATGEVTTLGFYLGASDPGPGFILPGGVATDGAGNLFVADPAFGMIRKVVIATGELTTLAGSLGSDGVDGTGVAAHFGTVWGVTSDGAGNLFVADTSTIRKVVIATGEVTTLAGSPGTYGSADGTGPNARFESGYQAGVATDGAGNLFVAEPANGTIRKVVIATRQVTTLAGSPGLQAAWTAPAPPRASSYQSMAVWPAMGREASSSPNTVARYESSSLRRAWSRRLPAPRKPTPPWTARAPLGRPVMARGTCSSPTPSRFGRSSSPRARSRRSLVLGPAAAPMAVAPPRASTASLASPATALKTCSSPTLATGRSGRW